MKTKLTIYISGPMTGLPDYNRQAFRGMADKLPRLKTCQHCGYELDWQTLGKETKPKPKADPVRPQAHPIREGYKTCTRCKETFEASTVNFYRNSRSPDGLYAQCKECRNKTMNRYYQKQKARTQA